MRKHVRRRCWLLPRLRRGGDVRGVTVVKTANVFHRGPRAGMRRYQQTVGGVVVGTVGVMIVGEAWHVAVADSPAPPKHLTAYTVPILPHQGGTPPDDETHRESRGTMTPRHA